MSRDPCMCFFFTAEETDEEKEPFSFLFLFTNRMMIDIVFSLSMLKAPNDVWQIPFIAPEPAGCSILFVFCHFFLWPHDVCIIICTRTTLTAYTGLLYSRVINVNISFFSPLNGHFFLLLTLLHRDPLLRSLAMPWALHWMISMENLQNVPLHLCPVFLIHNVRCEVAYIDLLHSSVTNCLVCCFLLKLTDKLLS